MSEYEYIRNDRLRSILDKRIENREYCEYCPGELGGNIDEGYPEADCNKCDQKEKFIKDMDVLYNEIISQPYKDPLDDNAVGYIDEFLCPACKYQYLISVGGSYWEPPDYEPMCAVSNIFYTKDPRKDGECIMCKGQFFIQNPKEDVPFMTYREYIGIDKFEGEDDDV